MRNVWLSLFLFLTVSCNSAHRDNNSGLPSLPLGDSLMQVYRDTMSIAPERAIAALTRVQAQSTDSLECYRLSLPIARSWYYANHIDKAIGMVRHTEQWSKTNRQLALYAEAVLLRAVLYQQINRHDSTIGLLQPVCESVILPNNAPKAPDTYITLADSYMLSGNFPMSAHYYRRALTVTDSLQLDGLHFPILSGLAKLYVDIGNYTLADYYFKEAAPYAAKGTDYEHYYFANCRGNYHYLTRDYATAEQYFKQGLQAAKQLNALQAQAISWANIGEVNLLMHRLHPARQSLDSASSYFARSPKDVATDFYLNGLYASLSLAENDLSAAERLLSKPFDETHILPSYLYMHQKRLQELYEKRGDYHRAYSYQQLVTAYDDSLRNQKVQNNLAEIEFRYKQDTTLLRKDILLARSEARASQWQKATMLSIFAILLLMIAGLYLALYRKRQHKLKYQQQLAFMNRLRMDAVRNRITPHFIFNVLNTVLPRFMSYKDLEQPLHKLVKVIRYSLVDSANIATPLNEELCRVQEFLELRAISYPEICPISWDIAPDVPFDLLIPSMSIQIPVENALKYAFLEPRYSQSPEIKVNINADSAYLHIRITDNGSGYDSRKADKELSVKGTGSGLDILSRTVDLLNQRNEQPILFQITNRSAQSPSQHGTEITIDIPLIYYFDL